MVDKGRSYCGGKGVSTRLGLCIIGHCVYSMKTNEAVSIDLLRIDPESRRELNGSY